MSTEPWWPGQVPPNAWATGAIAELKFGTIYPDDFNSSYFDLEWSSQWDPWDPPLGAPYRFYPNMSDKWVPGGTLAVDWYAVIMKAFGSDTPYVNGAFDGRDAISLRVDVRKAGGCSVRLGLCSTDFSMRVYSSIFSGFPDDLDTVTTCTAILQTPDTDIWKPAWPFMAYNTQGFAQHGWRLFEFSEFHAVGPELFWLPSSAPPPTGGPPGIVHTAAQRVGHVRL